MLRDERSDRIRVSVDPELEPLIPTFLKHRREEIFFLQEAFERLDYERIKMLGHRIKGVGGGYGFNALTQIAEGMELAAIRHNSQDIQSGLKNLVNYLGRVDVVYEAGQDIS